MVTFSWERVPLIHLWFLCLTHNNLKCRETHSSNLLYSQGVGNSFIFSNAITGWQIYHSSISKKFVNQMIEIEHMLYQHIISINDCFHKSSMENEAACMCYWYWNSFLLSRGSTKIATIHVCLKNFKPLAPQSWQWLSWISHLYRQHIRPIRYFSIIVKREDVNQQNPLIKLQEASCNIKSLEKLKI